MIGSSANTQLFPNNSGGLQVLDGNGNPTNVNTSKTRVSTQFSITTPAIAGQTIKVFYQIFNMKWPKTDGIYKISFSDPSYNPNVSNTPNTGTVPFSYEVSVSNGWYKILQSRAVDLGYISKSDDNTADLISHYYPFLAFVYGPEYNAMATTLSATNWILSENATTDTTKSLIYRRSNDGNCNNLIGLYSYNFLQNTSLALTSVNINTSTKNPYIALFNSYDTLHQRYTNYYNFNYNNTVWYTDNPLTMSCTKIV
jgi:hypothetical protein